MICEICEREFDINLVRGGHNRLICYDCLPDGLSKIERTNIRRKLLIRKNREYKLSLGCSICGYSKCANALEWHHPNKDKEFTPSNKIQQSWRLFLKEINKCILLCSNCHREVHDK